MTLRKLQVIRIKKENESNEKFSNFVKIVSTAKSTDDSTRMLELYNKREKTI